MRDIIEIFKNDKQNLNGTISVTRKTSYREVTFWLLMLISGYAWILIEWLWDLTRYLTNETDTFTIGVYFVEIDKK